MEVTLNLEMGMTGEEVRENIEEFIMNYITQVNQTTGEWDLEVAELIVKEYFYPVILDMTLDCDKIANNIEDLETPKELGKFEMALENFITHLLLVGAEVGKTFTENVDNPTKEDLPNSEKVVQLFENEGQDLH